jgi:CRISPR type III-associated protein (TIGR04423 family)
MKRVQLNEIDLSKSYTGYYWFSDKESPTVIRQEKITLDMFTELPFIVEANFVSDDGTSISIKNIDGVYEAFQVYLHDLPEDQITRQSFLAKTSLGVKAIKMVIFWDKDTETTYTGGMPELIPQWKAFAGFEEK